MNADDPRRAEYEECCTYPGGQYAPDPGQPLDGCEQIFARDADPDGIIRNPDLAGYRRRRPAGDS